MKQIVCEMCEGTDFVKDNGMFVCQGCGTKYTTEEARKLMVEVGGSAPAPARGPLSPEEQIAELLPKAETAIGQCKNADAESLTNQILALDATYAKAWLIKGQAVGWQTTVGKPRLTEATDCFQKAYTHAPAGEKKYYEDTIRDQSIRLAKAFMDLTCKNFIEIPCAENKKHIREAIAAMMTIQLELLKVRITMNSDEIYAYFAQKLNTAAVEASNKADNEFGTEKRKKTKAAWDKWRERSDLCLDLLKLAQEMSQKPSLLDTIQKNYKIICDTIIHSCSYKFQSSTNTYVKDYSLTQEAIKIRLRNFGTFTSETAKKKATIEKKEQKAKNEKYWAEHAEEKDALLEEQMALKEEVSAIEAELKAIEDRVSEQIRELKEKRKRKLIPEIDLEEQEKLIRELTAERDSLGFFKGKQKKAIDIRLQQIEYPRLAELKELAEHERATFNSEIDTKIASLEEEGSDLRKALEPKEARIKAIREELTKPR